MEVGLAPASACCWFPSRPETELFDEGSSDRERESVGVLDEDPMVVMRVRLFNVEAERMGTVESLRRIPHPE